MASRRPEALFRLRVGDREVRVEGTESLVREAMRQWMLAWGETTGASTESGRAGAADEAAESHAAVPVIRVQKNIGVLDLVALKEPDSPRDRLLTVAYYLERYEKRERYGLDQLRMLWLEAYPCLSMDPEAWEDALRDGYLERVADGQFTLTFSGESFVQNGLVEEYRAG
ncbi:MAG: hypothetical protein VKO21_03305 [Candidatus Sericytochromatia bacterium]|nr:hypothetical protein [Candidatus Sericytochromatia bacterium]